MVVRTQAKTICSAPPALSTPHSTKGVAAPTNLKGHLFHSQCKAFSGLTKGTPNAEMLLMTQLTLSWEATQPCWFLHSRDKSNSSTPRAVAAVEPEASRARAAAVKADPS